MAQYDKPLVGIVGVTGKDPEIKSTSKGDITKFSVAVSDGFGDDATTTWFNVAVFNEGLQTSIQAKNGIRKGNHVAVQGTVTQKDGYGPDMLAVRVGKITWLDRTRSGQAPAPAASSDEDDF